MHTCPHCQEDSITSWQKIFSMTFTPAECPNCHGKSYMHVIYGLAALTAWIVLTWIFIGLAWMSRSSFFLLGTVPAFIVSVNKYLLGAPLRPLRSP